MQSHFGIYSNNGSIYIKTPPDREEADQVILPVLVKDLNAWKSPKSQDVTREQTATGKNGDIYDRIKLLRSFAAYSSEIFHRILKEKDNEALTSI